VHRTMPRMSDPSIDELCELGQEQLIQTRYLEAEATLVRAEKAADASQDWDSLSRLYMPLQEARRQRRQRCGEGSVSLDLMAGSPNDVIDPKQIIEKFPHGQLLIAGWATFEPARRFRAMAAERGLYVETFLGAMYPVGDSKAVVIVPEDVAPLPPGTFPSIDELRNQLPVGCLVLAEAALPRGALKGTDETYGRVMDLWERLHAPFLAAADGATSLLNRIAGYRRTIRVDYACELAHQRLSDVARKLARQALATMIVAAVLMFSSSITRADPVADSQRQQDERLSFQTNAPWSGGIAINADVAMVYGIDAGLPARLESWKAHGYRAQVMTGVSWGHYEDYIHGRWDGKDHMDQRQTDRAGNPLGHGGDMWYMSPGEEYGKYLAEGVRRALDAGSEAIYLEEPEFWVRSGYSSSFKREWKAYYGEDWQPPHESADNQYRSSKLKYFLYRRALSQVFASVRDYGKAHGRTIPCYVPTHSLLNYSQWGIVSPESSLLDVGCDGYIAQVWTGTARTPNVYQGVTKSRTFETAFLEYGAMQNLVRASGRKVWYLNDPVEDNPRHSWADYRTNWESTLVASLLQPEVWRFEVMPWPERIFNGRHPATDPTDNTPRRAARVGIPTEYATELQTVISAMGDLKQPPERVRWEISGTQDVGVLVSDTMMFERGDPNPSDPWLGSFYGLAMPLVKHGLPIEPVQIENAATKGFLDRYKVLLLTYEGQKPPTAELHVTLANWVRAGGALVVIDDDRDPYNAVREWWNTAPLKFAAPRIDLFKKLGLAADANGLVHVGKGVVVYSALSPAALTHKESGDQTVRDLARQAADAVGVTWKETNALALRRGPYVVAAGLDESVPGAPTAVLRGKFIPLFDATLPLLTEVTLDPGRRAMLVDVAGEHAPGSILAAACRVTLPAVTPDEITFHADGVDQTQAIVCVALPKPPRGINVGGKTVASDQWSFSDGLLRIRFDNSAAGTSVVIAR
jgi:hypothetical protein